MQHWLGSKVAWVTNSVFRRTEMRFVGLINVTSAELHLINSTIYSASTENVPQAQDQPSHHWIKGTALHMANSVIADENKSHPFPVREFVRLEGGSVVLNVNNHVSDGSLAGAATGDPRLEGPNG